MGPFAITAGIALVIATFLVCGRSGPRAPSNSTTTAVWDWAAPGTPVRGCLVVDGRSRLTRNQYDYGKGPVVVHTPATLARELKAETSQPHELDERVANDVGKLRPRSGRGPA